LKYYPELIKAYQLIIPIKATP